MTVRKPETEQAYQNAKATGDLEPLHLVKPIKEWDYWKLVANRFPHDRLSAGLFNLKGVAMDKTAPTKAELEQHIKFLPLDPKANYLLVLNAQQISMQDAQSVIEMLETTKLTNACGAVLVYGDVNTAIKLIDVSKLQALIKKEQGVKGNGKKPTAKTSK